MTDDNCLPGIVRARLTLYVDTLKYRPDTSCLTQKNGKCISYILVMRVIYTQDIIFIVMLGTIEKSFLSTLLILLIAKYINIGK